MKKLLYLCCFLLSIHSWAQAQVELVPITENTAIQRHLGEKQLVPTKRSTAIEKNTCGNLEKPGITYVQAGNTVKIKISLDTAGLGRGTFQCVDCASARFGTANVVENTDTLVYTAFTNVNADEDQIEVAFCNESNVCRTRTYRILARRAGRVYNPPFLTPIVPGNKDTLVAVVSNLPGRKAVCGSFIDCQNTYDSGNQQELSFLNNNPSEGRFVYQASRFPGLDTVCIVLCDSFTICDTFKFAFRIPADTLDLPFMDDFSYFGPYPDDSHWLDLDVFVNNDMADTPPSWGVATFDGIDRNGTAYGGGYGTADQLTSNFIDLTTTGRDIYFTYWIQRRGFGDRPEVQDSFLVEFKNRRGEWVLMDALPGAPNNESDTAKSPFRFRSITIPNEFRYNTFQFRFRNKSDRTGLLDTWHVDYVRIDDKYPDKVFNDVAFTQMPEFILKRYTNMPWFQFRDYETQELNDFIVAKIWNHSPQPLASTGSVSTVRLWEQSSDVNMFNATLFNDQEGNIVNDTALTRIYSLRGPTQTLPKPFSNVWDAYILNIKNPKLDSTFAREKKLDFRLRYTMSYTQESDSLYDRAILRNDIVRRFTTFSDYFSYDDGTAEAGLVARQNVEVAVRYVLNKSDTLRAVQYHFPRTTVDIANQRFTIKVWVGKLDDTPEYQATGQQAYYADIYFDTLQGFTTYPLPTPLPLNSDTIYVGWEQETACDGTRCIPVGYDRNSTIGFAHAFRRTGNQAWQPFPPISRGSLMIRPVVGSKTPLATSTDDILKPERNFTLYPNPTREVLHITPNQGWYEDFQYLLFSSAGQLLRQGVLEAQLMVNDLPPGMYFLKIADRQTNQFWNEKFIIAR
ncbi:MAG: T9SS type A sorting domain-containing protein [Saprospiraceae bacterium]